MKMYGLLGRTLSHSFSKTYFSNKFAEEGLADCRYDNFEIETIEEFPSVLSSNPTLKGLNVTIPYKEQVVLFLTEKNEIVEKTGACNCIRIDGKKLAGFNTDAIGFRKALEPKLRSHHTNALILGTGGASKAIRFVLTELGIEYRQVSRKRTGSDLIYDDLQNDIIHHHHLIINTTPLGMYPGIEAAPLIPYQFITPDHFLFDVIYNPARTKFLIEGEKKGAQISNGYEMLIYQAEESWRIWSES